MTIKLKKGLIMLLSCLFIFNALLLLASQQTVKAEEPESEKEYDYTVQKYTLYDEQIDANLPNTDGFGGFGNFEEDEDSRDCVFRIDCPDLSSEYPDLTENELVKNKYIHIAFNYEYVWFVNGEVRTTMPELLQYVKVLQYDEIKNQIYVDFSIPVMNVACDGVDVSLIQRNREAGEMHYIQKANLIPNVALADTDAFFVADIKTADNIYSIKNVLKIRKDVAYLIDNINVSFLSGAEFFTLNKTIFTIEDGTSDNGYIIFDVIANGDIFAIQEKVQLKADITYIGKRLTVESTETDILTFWAILIENDFQGAENFTEYKSYITASVRSYQQSFSSQVKETTFELFDKEQYGIFNTENIIFAFNISDVMQGATFRLHWINNLFSLDVGPTIELFFDSGNIYGTAQYYYFLTGLTYGKIDDILYYADVCVVEDKIYIHINENPFYQETRYFSIIAKDKDDNEINVYVNNSEIIYDEYNQELLEELSNLKQQLADANKNLANSNATIDELRERVNSLKQTIDSLEATISNLETAYNRLDARYNALNEKYVQALTEIENLKAQKNKALEDLLAEVQAHQTTRATLEAQIAEKNGDIESLQAQLDEVNAILSEKEEALKNAQDDLTALEKRYEELETEYQAFLASSSDELVAISALMHEYKMSIGELEKQVAELQKQLEEEKQEKKEANGCSAGYNGFGGTTGGPGSGVDSTFLMTTLGLTMFAGVIYAKRTWTKKE